MPWKYDREKAVYLPPGCNPYGFRVNIHNPHIKKLYYKYIKWKGLNAYYPVSDRERFEFESYVIRMIEEKQNPPFV